MSRCIWQLPEEDRCRNESLPNDDFCERHAAIFDVMRGHREQETRLTLERLIAELEAEGMSDDEIAAMREQTEADIEALLEQMRREHDDQDGPGG